MSDPRHARIRSLYLEAAALAADQRGGFLARACAGEPDLAREVEELLAHGGAEGSGRLERLERVLDANGREALPEIDGYRLHGTIGEGGMGTVYDAEQVRPVRRRVAIKLLKRGLDTREILGRFALERQVLARAEHPNIARIFDAGESRDGRPFFAMERVDGEPITDFCDRYGLGLDARLRLFLGVCAAVQHAHQKGILHRDLKPSNLLVESFEGRPAVKVIDFGIAKSLWAEAAAGRTAHGQAIGTPDYMSPEQERGGDADVDTRSDVYALGVVLFELLTGTLPFARAGSPPRPRPDTDVSVPRPSDRLRRRAAVSAPAGHRGVTRTLARLLRRELDWIAIKALDPDRERRYASASELAADVERFLDDEPVIARPPSAVYRLRKLTRRHRLAVAVVATFSAATVLGLAGTSFGLLRARRAEADARQQARAAEEVSHFLVDVFRNADPYATAGEEPTARALLDRGRERIETFDADPAVRATLVRTLGRVHSNLALYADAEPLLQESVDLHRTTFGADDPRTATAVLDLAWLYNEQARYADAEPLLMAAIPGLETAPDEHVADLAQAHQVLGVILRNSGALDRARSHLERSLGLRVDHLGASHKDVGFSLYHLGWLERMQGRYATAEDLYRRALAVWEPTVGADSPLVGWCHNDLGIVLSDQERTAEARDHLERALATQEKALGPRHPAVAAPLQSLAALLSDLGRHDEALGHLERALAIRQEALGPEHADVAALLGNIARELRLLSRFDHAEGIFERALEMTRATAGETSALYASTLNNFAAMHRFLGRLERARSLIEEVLTIQETSLGDDHPSLAFTLTNLARTDFAGERFAEAEASYARAVRIRERALGDGYALGFTLCQLGEVRGILGRHDAAAADVARGSAMLDEAAADRVDDRAACLLMAAQVAARRGRSTEAAQAVAAAQDLLDAHGRRATGRLLRRRAGCHALLGDVDDALRDLEAALDDGYRTPDLARHPDLRALRGMDRFDRLAARAAGVSG